MNAEQVAGYIVTALSAVGFWTIRLCLQAVNKCVAIDREIVTNFRWALKEYGSAVPTDSITSTPFYQAVDRLVMLAGTTLDIRTLRDRLAVVLWIAVALLLVTLAAFVIGCAEAVTSLVGSRLLNLIAPFVLLLIQVALFYVAIKGQRFIEGVAAKLKSEREDYSADWSAGT
jgi:hypothetical protein